VSGFGGKTGTTWQRWAKKGGVEGGPNGREKRRGKAPRGGESNGDPPGTKTHALHRCTTKPCKLFQITPHLDARRGINVAHSARRDIKAACPGIGAHWAAMFSHSGTLRQYIQPAARIRAVYSARGEILGQYIGLGEILGQYMGRANSPMGQFDPRQAVTATVGVDQTQQRPV
jgi:hypothetical protein